MDPQNPQPQTPQTTPVAPAPEVAPPPVVETPVPVEAQPPVTPPAEEPKKGSSLSKIALTLLIVAIIAIAAYILGTVFTKPKVVATPTPILLATPIPTPSTDPNTNWKTYTDNQIGFSFKYPPEWTYRLGDTNSTTGSVIFDTGQLDSEKKVNYSFDVALETQSNLNEWTKYESTVALPTQTINGTVFEKYIAADLYYSLNYIYKSGSKIIRLLVYPYNQNQFPEMLKTEIDQILSTFKFLEGTPAATSTASPSATPM